MSWGLEDEVWPYGPFPMARREWTLNQLAPLASGKDREDEVPRNITVIFQGQTLKNHQVTLELWETG